MPDSSFEFEPLPSGYPLNERQLFNSNYALYNGFKWDEDYMQPPLPAWYTEQISEIEEPIDGFIAGPSYVDELGFCENFQQECMIEPFQGQEFCPQKQKRILEITAPSEEKKGSVEVKSKKKLKKSPNMKEQIQKWIEPPPSELMYQAKNQRSGLSSPASRIDISKFETIPAKLRKFEIVNLVLWVKVKECVEFYKSKT